MALVLQGLQARVYGKGTAVDGSPPLKRRHPDSAAPPSPIEPAQGQSPQPQPAAAPEPPKLPTSAFVGVTWAKKRKEVQGGKTSTRPFCSGSACCCSISRYISFQ